MVRRFLEGAFIVVIGIGMLGCGGGRTAGPAGGESSVVVKPVTKGDRTLVASSEGVKPMWLQECPVKTEHIMPFCGQAYKQPSHKMACQAAYADAIGKLQRTISQETSASLKPDGKGGYQFEMACAGTEPSTLRGVWEDQQWWEEYDGPGGRSYDCHVMLTYPMLEYHNLTGMARKAIQDWVGKANELSSEGKTKSSNCQYAEAAVLFERAKNLLGCLKEPLITPDGMNSSLMNEQIEADLKVARVESVKAQKTALVVIRLSMDGKEITRGGVADSVRNKVKNWLSNRGLRIRPGGLDKQEVSLVLSGDRQAAARAAASKCAGLLLVIDLESNFKAKEEGICYAFAQGAFRLIRTSDGRELATADLGPEKGALFNEQAARQRAVENLCQKQLGKVVQEALAKI